MDGKNLGFAKKAQANVYRLVHGRWSANDEGNGYAVKKVELRQSRYPRSKLQF